MAFLLICSTVDLGGVLKTGISGWRLKYRNFIIFVVPSVMRWQVFHLWVVNDQEEQNWEAVEKFTAFSFEMGKNSRKTLDLRSL